MSIRIRSVALTGTGAAAPADGYLDKIVKSIPSQVIAFYTAGITWLGGTPTAGAPPNPRLWIAFAVGLILTPLLTWRQTHEPGKPPAYQQIAVATVSFAVWAFATGGPFATFGFWDAGVATLVLAAYTLAIGAIPQT